jgi:hypothetical protein
MQVGEFFLKLLLVIAFISFYLLYYKIGKKYFVKVPPKISLKSWANYVLVWGLVYANICMCIILPWLTFCFLMCVMSIEDSFMFAIELFFSSPFYYIFLPIAFFLIYNISYFYYGIFLPWWKKL